MSEADIGMAGVGVMGSNLALNMERNGFAVVIWDHTPDFVEKAIAGIGPGKRIQAAKTPEEFARAIKRPRKIMMMVKAGAPVDWTVDQFKPYLKKGDILIDGGNSWFEDTRRREAALAEQGFLFIGSGVFRRRRGRAKWTKLDARRNARGLPGDSPYLGSDRRQDRRWPLNDLRWAGCGGPFRQDGAQRHRVRRYATDR